MASELLQRVVTCTPAFFDSLVVRLLIAMGYGGSVNELDRALVGKSGDGGVDGVIDQDSPSLDRVYVEAKRYAPDDSVGASAIRDFFGSLDEGFEAKAPEIARVGQASSARRLLVGTIPLRYSSQNRFRAASAAAWSCLA